MGFVGESHDSGESAEGWHVVMLYFTNLYQNIFTQNFAWKKERREIKAALVRRKICERYWRLEEALFPHGSYTQWCTADAMLLVEFRIHVINITDDFHWEVAHVTSNEPRSSFRVLHSILWLTSSAFPSCEVLAKIRNLSDDISNNFDKKVIDFSRAQISSLYDGHVRRYSRSHL